MMDILDNQEDEPIVEPVVEPIVEPVVEPIVEPVVEPIVEPVVEPIAATSITPTAFVPEDNKLAIHEAFGEGLSPSQVADRFANSSGQLPEDVLDTITKMNQSTVYDLQQQGESKEQIEEILHQSGYSFAAIDGIMAKFESPSAQDRVKKYQWNPNDTTVTEQVENIESSYNNIYRSYSDLGRGVLSSAGGLSSHIFGTSFGEEEGIQARRNINTINFGLVDKLVDEGYDAFINPETGEAMYRDEAGNVQVLNGNIIKDLIAGTGELLGQLGGGTLGYKALGGKLGKAGSIVGGTIAGAVRRGNPKAIKFGAGVGQAIGRGAATAIGSATGATAGRGLDITLNAQLLKEDIETSLYVTQMKEAAIFDAASGVLGVAAIRTTKELGKGIMNAYNFVVQGNSKGGYKLLIDNALMNESQATEFIKRAEKVTGVKKPLFQEEYAYRIKVLGTGIKRAETPVRQAIGESDKAANLVANTLDKQTKELRSAIKEVTGEKVGKLITDDLNTYVEDVGEFFGATKDILKEASSGKGFSYDRSKLGIDKVLNFITRGRDIKNVQIAAVLDSKGVAEIGITEALQDKSVNGLFELRQTLNRLKQGTKLQAPDSKVLNGVLNSIDRQIDDAARTYLPKGEAKVWVSKWKEAKESFSTMKKLEKNAFFTTLTKGKSGLVTESMVEENFAKYIDSHNQTFLDVVKHLPKSTQEKAEAAIINRHMANNTFGKISDFEVTDFPELARTLGGIEFKSPRGKALNKYIHDLSNVWQNNINLSGATGKVQLPKGTIPIASSVPDKARMTLINTVWTEIRALAPTKLNAGRSLIKTLDKVLEEPTHVSTINKFLSTLPEASREGAVSMVKELQVAMVGAPKPAPSDFKNMYKQSSTGKFTVTNGSLGRGVYLVDSVKNPNPASKVIKQEVNMSRMATLDTISEIVGRKVTAKDIRNLPDIASQLSERGYNGIRVEGRAILFPEQSFKKTIDKP